MDIGWSRRLGTRPRGFNQPKEENERLKVAWIVTTYSTLLGVEAIRLFTTAWENPLPEVAVESIDFISDREDAAPFLIAITAE